MTKNEDDVVENEKSMKQQKGDPAPAPNPFKYPQILVFFSGCYRDPFRPLCL